MGELTASTSKDEAQLDEHTAALAMRVLTHASHRLFRRCLDAGGVDDWFATRPKLRGKDDSDTELGAIFRASAPSPGCS